MESTVGFTGPKASTDALFVAAEAVNNEGSKLYRQGSFEAAATSYSEALARLGKSAGYRDGNTSDECPRRRSKYYANRSDIVVVQLAPALARELGEERQNRPAESSETMQETTIPCTTFDIFVEFYRHLVIASYDFRA